LYPHSACSLQRLFPPKTGNGFDCVGFPFCTNRGNWPPAYDLRAGTRDEAANLGVAVVVVIGPHNGWAETVGLSHYRVVRHHKPFSLNADTIMAPCVSQSTSCTLTPSAKAQHNPFLLPR